jgi:hypothetical protein
VSDIRPVQRPPLALGCAIIVAAVVVVVAAAAWFVGFLESGSNTGRVTLDPLAAYPPGTVTRFAKDGFYVVRLPGGAVLALSDLDAANRASAGRRCKVAPIPPADPGYQPALERYRSSFSAEATGATLIFREDCNGALYDAAGMRLDTAGRNLDRFATTVDETGRLVVITVRRECSVRDGDEGHRIVACP